jgi:hypothetical protein
MLNLNKNWNYPAIHTNFISVRYYCLVVILFIHKIEQPPPAIVIISRKNW